MAKHQGGWNSWKVKKLCEKNIFVLLLKTVWCVVSKHTCVFMIVVFIIIFIVNKFPKLFFF